MRGLQVTMSNNQTCTGSMIHTKIRLNSPWSSPAQYSTTVQHGGPRQHSFCCVDCTMVYFAPGWPQWRDPAFWIRRAALEGSSVHAGGGTGSTTDHQVCPLCGSERKMESTVRACACAFLRESVRKEVCAFWFDWSIYLFCSLLLAHHTNTYIHISKVKRKEVCAVKSWDKRHNYIKAEIPLWFLSKYVKSTIVIMKL